MSVDTVAFIIGVAAFIVFVVAATEFVFFARGLHSIPVPARVLVEGLPLRSYPRVPGIVASAVVALVPEVFVLYLAIARSGELTVFGLSVLYAEVIAAGIWVAWLLRGAEEASR